MNPFKSGKNLRRNSIVREDTIQVVMNFKLQVALLLSFACASESTARASVCCLFIEKFQVWQKTGAMKMAILTVGVIDIQLAMEFVRVLSTLTSTLFRQDTLRADWFSPTWTKYQSRQITRTTGTAIL